TTRISIGSTFFLCLSPRQLLLLLLLFTTVLRRPALRLPSHPVSPTPCVPPARHPLSPLHPLLALLDHCFLPRIPTPRLRRGTIPHLLLHHRFQDVLRNMSLCRFSLRQGETSSRLQNHGHLVRDQIPLRR
ncbi:hypothetical protein BGZ65_011972, partial [Modicella reniformis]